MRPLVFVRLRRILAHGHIQTPVQPVLHAPVRANAVRQHIGAGVRRQAAQVVTAGLLAVSVWASHLE